MAVLTLLRNCDSCGVEYLAKRAASKYCSDTCRKRGSRSPAKPRPETERAPLPPADLVDTTRKQLEDAGVIDTVAGQSALILAGRMAGTFDTGSAIAALNRELHATMERALSLASVVADPMDELRARRERRNAS